MKLTVLVERGILAPISEPTEWVSQMAVVQKAILRVWNDQQPLNEALMGEHYKLNQARITGIWDSCTEATTN